MINPLYNKLPNKADFAPQYTINTDFRIGIQVAQALSDDNLTDTDRAGVLLALMFSNEDGTMRQFPEDEETLISLVDWLINGWDNDTNYKKERNIPIPESQHTENNAKQKRYVDYDVDSWRIYADFLSVYKIDLNSISGMHYWAFCALLWNMPYKQSSFLSVVDIRKKKITKTTCAEEKEAIKEAQKNYALEPVMNYSEEEKNKIDDFNNFMKNAKRVN